VHRGELAGEVLEEHGLPRARRRLDDHAREPPVRNERLQPGGAALTPLVAHGDFEELMLPFRRARARGRLVEHRERPFGVDVLGLGGHRAQRDVEPGAVERLPAARLAEPLVRACLPLRVAGEEVGALPRFEGGARARRDGDPVLQPVGEVLQRAGSGLVLGGEAAVCLDAPTQRLERRGLVLRDVVRIDPRELHPDGALAEEGAERVATAGSPADEDHAEVALPRTGDGVTAALGLRVEVHRDEAACGVVAQALDRRGEVVADRAVDVAVAGEQEHHDAGVPERAGGERDVVTGRERRGPREHPRAVGDGLMERAGLVARGVPVGDEEVPPWLAHRSRKVPALPATVTRWVPPAGGGAQRVGAQTSLRALPSGRAAPRTYESAPR